MSQDTVEWRATAEALREHGVPERRAEIVARVDAGQTYREVADDMGIASHGSVGNQVDEYRNRLAESRWLVEHAPDI